VAEDDHREPFLWLAVDWDHFWNFEKVKLWREDVEKRRDEKCGKTLSQLPVEPVSDLLWIVETVEFRVFNPFFFFFQRLKPRSF